MATVRAFIQTSKKTQLVPIRFKLSYGRHKEVCYTSEMKVDPINWNATKQNVTKGYEKESYNGNIAARKALIEKIYNDKPYDVDVTSEWLNLEIDKNLHPERYQIEEEKPLMLLQYVKMFIEAAPQRKDRQTGRYLTPNNIQQYVATEKHLKYFAKIKNRDDFEFNQIDQTFYSEFVEYLQNKIVAKDESGNVILKKDGILY